MDAMASCFKPSDSSSSGSSGSSLSGSYSESESSIKETFSRTSLPPTVPLPPHPSLVSPAYSAELNPLDMSTWSSDPNSPNFRVGVSLSDLASLLSPPPTGPNTLPIPLSPATSAEILSSRFLRTSSNYLHHKSVTSSLDDITETHYIPAKSRALLQDHSFFLSSSREVLRHPLIYEKDRSCTRREKVESVRPVTVKAFRSRIERHQYAAKLTYPDRLVLEMWVLGHAVPTANLC